MLSGKSFSGVSRRPIEDKAPYEIAGERLAEHKCPHGHGYMIFESSYSRKCQSCAYEDKSDVPYVIPYRFGIELPTEKGSDYACKVTAFLGSGERAYSLPFVNQVDAQEYIGILTGTIQMAKLPDEVPVRIKPTAQSAISIGTFKELLHLPPDWDISGLTISWTTGAVRLSLFNPNESHMDGRRLPFYKPKLRRREDGTIICDGWEKI